MKYIKKAYVLKDSVQKMMIMTRVTMMRGCTGIRPQLPVKKPHSSLLHNNSSRTEKSVCTLSSSSCQQKWLSSMDSNSSNTTRSFNTTECSLSKSESDTSPTAVQSSQVSLTKPCHMNCYVKLKSLKRIYSLENFDFFFFLM